MRDDRGCLKSISMEVNSSMQKKHFSGLPQGRGQTRFFMDSHDPDGYISIREWSFDSLIARPLYRQNHNYR